MPSIRKIAVAGATGRVGRYVVDALTNRGYDVVPISRSTGVDVITGEGLAAALTGVDAIVDAATGPSPDEDAATTFFTTSARNLQQAGQEAGARRVVVVSIIGTDRFTAGYGAAKNAHEKAMVAGPIPAHILRAAQFHEFVGQLVDWGTRNGIGSVPRMRTQLVAARSVGEELAELAIGDGFTDKAVTEIAGPREENLVDAATLLAAHRGYPAKIEAVALPEDLYGNLDDTGALLPGPGAVLTGPTFEDWLDATT
jgi:uncharacterized protein YbjT (DUF2867 family)